MNPKNLAVMLFIFLFATSVYAAETSSKAKEPVKAKVVKIAPVVGIESTEVKPTTTYLSRSLDQLGRGVSNMVYAPAELLYRLKNEVTYQDPIKGVLPGIIKGASWAVAREFIGIIEVGTFYAPSAKPNLPPFDTDWLFA